MERLATIYNIFQTTEAFEGNYLHGSKRERCVAERMLLAKVAFIFQPGTVSQLGWPAISSTETLVSFFTILNVVDQTKRLSHFGDPKKIRSIFVVVVILQVPLPR